MTSRLYKSPAVTLVDPGTPHQRHALTVLCQTVGRHEGASAHPELRPAWELSEGPSHALLAFVHGRDVADTDAMLAELAAASKHDMQLPELVAEFDQAGHATSVHDAEWWIAFVPEKAGA